MFFGGAAFLVVLVTLAGLVLLVMALVDLVRRPAGQFEASGHNQLVWALIVIFVGFIGPLLYLLIARPALDAAAAPTTAAETGTASKFTHGSQLDSDAPGRPSTAPTMPPTAETAE
ncbi:MAG: PLD nuclease N-terminal domain-containing protein [Acidimicrobiia bacterium]